MNAAGPLEWDERQVSDDVGTKEKPAMIETVLVAYDREGCEWLVAEHDDHTWNWFRCDADGEVLYGGTDYPTREAARAGAESRARRELYR